MMAPKENEAGPAGKSDDGSSKDAISSSVSSGIDSSSTRLSHDKVSKPMVPFRYPWQHKLDSKHGPKYLSSGQSLPSKFLSKKAGSSSELPAYNSDNAVANNRDSSAAGNSYGVDGVNGGFQVPMSFVSDKNAPLKEGNSGTPDSDGQSTDATEVSPDPVGPDHPSVPRAMNNMEKARKKMKSPSNRPDPNGRLKGRKLVLWHRARMPEKLLLHIQYECHRANIHLPWDDIVHRLSPGSSGPCATQMLNKLRDVLVAEGHMIPPLLGKGPQYHDESVRGYVRDMNAPNPTTMRALLWTEEYEDKKESLVTPGIGQGSGRYPRGSAQVLMVPDTGDERRSRLPRDIKEKLEAKKAEAKNNKKCTRKIKQEPIDEPNFNDLDSDAEYQPVTSSAKRKAPKKTAASKNKSPRVVKKKISKADFSSDAYSESNATDNDEFFFSQDKTPRSSPIDRGVSTPSSTPAPSRPVILSLPRDMLVRFPAGVSGSSIATARSNSTVSAISNESSFRSRHDAGGEDAALVQSPDGMLDAEREQEESLRNAIQQNISYQGPEIDGSLQDFARRLGASTNLLRNKEKPKAKWAGSSHKDPFTTAHSASYVTQPQVARSSGYTTPTSYGPSIAAFGSPHSTGLSNIFARDTDFDFNCTPGADAPELYGDHKPNISWKNSPNHGNNLHHINGSYEDNEDPFDDDYLCSPMPPYAAPPFLAYQHTPPNNPVPQSIANGIDSWGVVEYSAGFDTVVRNQEASQTCVDNHNASSGEAGTLDTYGHGMNTLISNPLAGGERSDFISTPGHIFEDPTPSHHVFNTGLNHGLISSEALLQNTRRTGAHPLLDSHHFFDENDENNAPNGLESPGYHGADNVNTHGNGWAGHL